jgi:hypothetical protein
MPCSDGIRFKPLNWLRSITLVLLLLNFSIAVMLSLLFTSQFVHSTDESGSGIERGTLVMLALAIPLTTILTSFIMVSITKAWKYLIDVHIVQHGISGLKTTHTPMLSKMLISQVCSGIPLPPDSDSSIQLDTEEVSSSRILPGENAFEGEGEEEEEEEEESEPDTTEISHKLLKQQFKFTKRTIGSTDIIAGMYIGFLLFILCIGICFAYLHSTSMTLYKVLDITLVGVASVVLDYLLIRPLVIAVSYACSFCKRKEKETGMKGSLLEKPHTE